MSFDAEIESRLRHNVAYRVRPRAGDLRALLAAYDALLHAHGEGMMYTVALPLTDAEIQVLESMALAAKMTVGEWIAILLREEWDAARPLVPNLG